ncbi:MAG: radical SAM protein [Thermodesulfobacteriota bacterium]|nr:radical SAM protein [Thermodesulfobacteriota bacterium]
MSYKLIEKANNLLLKETGYVKKDWGGKISVALVYPNTYYVGMSNLGLHVVYRKLNEYTHIVCERSFLPDKDDSNIYDVRRLSLFSLESKKNLYEFDFIAFCLSYESDYLNILKILDWGNIPILAEDRKDDDVPIVCAGGIAPTLNPEPISKFIDFFVIGEAEEVLDELSEHLRRKYEAQKETFLNELSTIEGVYVPSLYEVVNNADGTIKHYIPRQQTKKQIKKRWIPNLDEAPARTSLFTSCTEFGDIFTVEVNRGCARSCRFCAAGHTYLPPRNVSLQRFTHLLRDGLQYRNKLGLLGTAVCDHPDIAQYGDMVIEAGATLSFSSLRADTITPKIGQLLKASHQRTVALAPETGSQKLRDLIGKGISEEDILEAVRILFSHDVFNLRLYFMIGLPEETIDDLWEILRLIKKIKHSMIQISRPKGKIGKIHASINSFVPKANTPFQWYPMEDVGSLKEKTKFLRDHIRRLDNVSIDFDVPKWAFVQALLSRGDRKVADFLVHAFETGSNWQKTFKHLNVNPEFYVRRIREENEVFPWDFIDSGVPKSYLLSEYTASLRTNK